MARCNYCKKEMLTAKGCTVSKVKIDGTIYPRVKVGGNKDDLYYNQLGTRCGDCGSSYGYYHHPYCDIEVSPVDGTQLLSHYDEFIK